jgi:hypothetical protein
MLKGVVGGVSVTSDRGRVEKMKILWQDLKTRLPHGPRLRFITLWPVFYLMLGLFCLALFWQPVPPANAVDCLVREPDCSSAVALWVQAFTLVTGALAALFTFGSEREPDPIVTVPSGSASSGNIAPSGSSTPSMVKPRSRAAYGTPDEENLTVTVRGGFRSPVDITISRDVPFIGESTWPTNE